MKTKKILIYSISILAIITILVTSVIGYLYWAGVKANKPVKELGTSQLVPNKKTFKLGELITVKTTFIAPWHRHPLAVSVATKKGIQLVDKPTFSKKKIQTDSIIWEVEAHLRPYREGKLNTGTLTITFNPPNDDTPATTLTATFPKVEVTPLNDHSGTLHLAGKAHAVTDNSGLYTLLGVIIVILLIVAFIIMWVERKQHREAKLRLPYWVLILDDLHQLQTTVKSENSLSKKEWRQLTDIVRDYLEKRFNLSAPQQTTSEFLRTLNKSTSPLPKNYQQFLRDFLMIADKVKFANMISDKEQFNDALASAEQLIEETKPVPETKGGK